MKRNIIIAALMVAGLAQADVMGLTDTAAVQGGDNGDTVVSVGSTAPLKNAGNESFTKIVMMKADLTAIGNDISAATFNVYTKADSASDYNLYVWAVKDSATGQDWSSATATWNSVTTAGLFTPKADLYSIGDANLTLLGSSLVPNGGGSTPNVLSSFSGTDLVSSINSRLDNDNLTFILAIDANLSVAARPHDHSAAPSLEYTVIPEPATLSLIALVGTGIFAIRRVFMIG